MVSQDKKWEKKFFDKMSIRLESYDVFDKEGCKRLVHFFYDLVQPKRGEKMVELGCGTGSFIGNLPDFGLDLTGVDISENSIKYAREKKKNINFFIGDIENLTFFENEFFDIVVFGGVLHHFIDFTKCVKEAHRILKIGGRVFAYEPNKRNPILWLYRDKNSPVHSVTGVTINERLLIAEEIKEVLTKVGFNKINVFATSSIIYKYARTKIAKFFLPFYNLWEKIFDKTPFSRRYGSFLIISAIKTV